MDMTPSFFSQRFAANLLRDGDENSELENIENVDNSNV
jgi:hypothetical protein